MCRRRACVSLIVTLVIASAGASSAQAPAPATALRVVSPSGQLAVSVDVPSGRPTYAVTLGGRTVLRPSGLGLVFEGAPRLDSSMAVVRTARSAALRADVRTAQNSRPHMEQCSWPPPPAALVSA